MIYFQASEDNLTVEYKERDKLLEELKNGITPKEKNGIPIFLFVMNMYKSKKINKSLTYNVHVVLILALYDQ